MGKLEDAVLCYKDSLRIDPACTATLENTDNLLCQLVDRWHFQMLNDAERNNAFKKAIQNARETGRHKLLDIGSGTCILRY